MKKDDLDAMLNHICSVDYVHFSVLAPTKEMLDRYKKAVSTSEYERRFIDLVGERKIGRVNLETLENASLLSV